MELAFNGSFGRRVKVLEVPLLQNGLVCSLKAVLSSQLGRERLRQFALPLSLVKLGIDVF